MRSCPSLGAHLRYALSWGVGFGLAVGHVDVAVRLLAMNIEWFEIYQALLVSVISGVLIYLLCSVLLHIVKRPYSFESLRHFYTVESVFLFIVIFTAYILNSVIFLDVSFFKPRLLEANLLALLFILTLYFICLRRGHALSSKVLTIGVRCIQLLRLKDYSFLVIVFTLSLFLYDGYYYLYPKTVSPSAPKTQPDQPNIVLVSLDTLRADHLSFYGYDKETAPFLSSIAAKSVLFENAYSSGPWTLPAHSGIFTGKLPSQHGADFDHQKLNSEHLTLAEILSAQGYHSWGFVGGPYCRAKYGVAQGFQNYRDRIDFFSYRHTSDNFSIRRLLDFLHPQLRLSLLRADGEKLAGELNTELRRDIANISEPFLLFMNYFDSHDPYTSGDKYRELFTDDKTRYEDVAGAIISIYSNPELKYRNNAPPEELPILLKALYDSEIRAMDDEIRNFVGLLQDSGKLENTIVIFFSDHGEEFFEHGGVLHGDTLYQELIRVPLFIYAPSRFAPARIKPPVSTVDLFATILEINQLENERFASNSLLTLLKGGSEYSGKGIVAERAGRIAQAESGLKSVINDGWKLIEVTPTKERIPNSLFDLEHDSSEKQNLYDSRADIKEHLQTLLRVP